LFFEVDVPLKPNKKHGNNSTTYAILQQSFHHYSMQVHIKENSFLARLAAIKLKSAQVAIVFGKTIHLHNTTREEFLNNQAWVRHELKHIEQYQRYGIARFIVLYLVESIKKGYYNNRFEIEARKAEE
jgi:hypothetical protein